MPDFPVKKSQQYKDDLTRYSSQGDLTTQQPSFLAPEDKTGEFISEAGSKIGSQIQDITVKWSNAVNTIQKTTSEANFKIGMADILARAEADPDYNNSEKYIKELDKLKSDNTKGFTHKLAETEMAIDLGYQSKVAGIQVNNIYRKKMIDVGQVSALKLLDMEAANYSSETEDRIGQLLGKQVEAGIFSHEAAYKLQKEYLKKGKFNSFLGDLNSSLASTDDNLSKNTYGFDMKELRDAKSIYKTESEKIRAKNENDILMSYLNGEEVEPDTIKTMMNEKTIGAKFADGMIKKLDDPKPDKASQDLAYIDFQNRAMDIQEKGDKATISELSKFMTDIIDSHSKGLIDKSDAQKALIGQNEMLQKKLDPLAEQTMEKVKPKTFLERISFWSDEYAKERPEIKARMYRKLIDGIGRGEDPDVLLPKIIDQEIDIQLSDKIKESDRQFAKNPETKQKIYSDDGGATWFDEKTGKEIK